MLPEVVWAMPRFGTFNVHAALLPQYRGCSDKLGGDKRRDDDRCHDVFPDPHDIDTGRIIMQREFPVPDEADVEYVYDGLMNLGAQICLDTVNLVIDTDGNVPSQPQNEDVQLHSAPKIFKETCEIDWNQSSKRV